MKIACIGNMNNMVFPLCLYLRDRGYCVTLFLLEEFDHFLPHADTHDEIKNIDIVNVGWTSVNFGEFSKDQLKSILGGFDFLIGTNFAPAFVYKAGLKLDIFFPTGSDLFDWPFRKQILYPFAFWIIERTKCFKCQRFGIKEAAYVSMDPAALMDESLRKINAKAKRIPALPFLYMPQYTDTSFEKSKYFSVLKKIREENDFIILQQCRQWWKSCDNPRYSRGNDNLIYGFADFLKDLKVKTGKKLILLEYGDDVTDSKNLIKKLDIEEYVIWLPKMYRKDLMTSIYLCDIGVGETGIDSWLSYGSVYEILAMKKPFIGYREDEQYVNQYSELYPMASANTAEGIRQIFNDFQIRPQYYKEMGLKAHEWFLKYAINRSLDKTIDVIEAKRKMLSNKSTFFKIEFLSLSHYTLIPLNVLSFVCKIKHKIRLLSEKFITN